jgi:hypothetical protein
LPMQLKKDYFLCAFCHFCCRRRGDFIHSSGTEVESNTIIKPRHLWLKKVPRRYMAI